MGYTHLSVAGGITSVDSQVFVSPSVTTADLAAPLTSLNLLSSYRERHGNQPPSAPKSAVACAELRKASFPRLCFPSTLAVLGVYVTFEGLPRPLRSAYRVW